MEFIDGIGSADLDVYLPGGQFLAAVADHPELALGGDPPQVVENAALADVRRAVCAALPALLARLLASPPPWSPLLRLLLLDVATALFPRPAFRRAYERLRCGANPEAEKDYAELLRLVVATSLQSVEAVLEQHLMQEGKLSVPDVRKEALRRPEQAAKAARSAQEAESFERVAEPPSGALDWLDVLYPDSAELPFSERAFHLMPALSAAPLLCNLDGTLLSLGEVIRDFQQHGHVLHASRLAALSEVPAERPIICDPGSLVQPALCCLFGQGSLRDADES
jgi:hypothetical protein